ncbi:MAG: hypothetical protein ABIQ95_04600 [Bdellovibrionia bacterium]
MIRQSRALFLIGWISVLGFWSSSVVAQPSSDPEEYRALLLNQSIRPSVKQIENLLAIGVVTPLRNRTDLPKYEHKPRHDLQYNYPIWFATLIAGAPKMIAEFENSFPGATWAFIGRDMGIIADLFEAFYRSSGQTDRVVRINMSTGTLKGLTPELAFEYLTQHGYEENSKTPFILVDSVSRGGGRQGRTLIAAAYSRDPKTAYQKLSKLNYIGLRVVTTEIPDSPLKLSKDILRVESYLYKNELIEDFFTRHRILTFGDNQVREDFISCNEAGYEHWIGAWHGSYGPLSRTQDGILVPQRGPDSAYSKSIREAVLDYQLNVIQAVQKPKFLNKVEQEAKILDYHFSQVSLVQQDEPPVTRINALIQRVGIDSAAHVSIAMKSFRELKTIQEYEDLIKPAKNSQNAAYKKAKRAFKRNVLGIYPFWHFKHWAKNGSRPSSTQSRGNGQ